MNDSEFSVIWSPYGEYLESRVSDFCRYFGAKDIDDLRRKSVQDIENFWKRVDEFLGFKWRKKYAKVLDVSEGIEFAKWFPDGKINLAENCLRWKNSQLSLIWEGEEGKQMTLTYLELLELTAKIAGGLRKLGVKKGDRVGLFMPLTPYAVASFLAVAYIGAIVVPMFSGYGPESVSVRLNDAEAKVLITSDGFWRKGKQINMLEVALEAVKSSPSVEKIVVFERLGNLAKLSGNLLVKGQDLLDSDPVEPEDTWSEDIFMIIYTSGTTGKPKGAVHVHGGFLVKIAEEGAFQTDLRQGRTLFWITDIGWIMGPWEIVAALANGATLFVYDGAPDFPEPSRVFDMVAAHRINALGLSPTFVRSIMKFDENKVIKKKPDSLKFICSTGEPWNYSPYMWTFEKIGGGKVPIINLSGGTEVGACFLSPHPIDKIKPMSLVGPSLGMDVDIFDENGKPVQHETVGELICKQPWPGMTRSIWKDKQRYIDTYWSRFKGVWYHGDFASRDKDGFWFLHGRSDDTIKVAGKRIGPAEIESIVVGTGEVIESAAIGVPDELKGESIVVFAVPKGEPTEDLRETIKRAVAEKLGKSFAPKDVKFVKALPKTRNAKIMRRVIRAKYLGKPTGDISSLENPDAVEEIERAF
ncbi:MAG: AMP-binding protein [Candidatus Calescibacterium sp.]|nr:AMP-binding protein [Candidatus Calescibacterium sp.]